MCVCMCLCVPTYIDREHSLRLRTPEELFLLSEMCKLGAESASLRENETQVLVWPPPPGKLLYGNVCPRTVEG